VVLVKGDASQVAFGRFMRALGRDAPVKLGRVKERGKRMRALTGRKRAKGG
jgi:hypothetical protein